MPKILQITLLVTVTLITLNLIFIDYRIFFNLSPQTPLQTPQTLVTAPTPTATATTISQKPALTPTATPPASCTTTKTSSTPQTQNQTTTANIAYLPLGGAPFSTIQTAWTTIPGSEFIINPADYPAKAKIYWQANLKISDPGSRCFARLFDTTNSRVVDFSEQSSASTSFETLTSSPLAIWSNANHYRVEVKSLNSFPCYIDSPKIIVKN